MGDKIRWGIIGTGWIAHKFAQGLTVVPDAELVAVGSRSIESAEVFANTFGVPRRYSSYEALVEDQGVQAVYISTPHPQHHANTLLALNAGKPVLCEKPFALNTAQATEMIEAARARGLFLMEAMWTRFIPAVVRVRELLAAGAIGQPRLLTADFGFRVPFDPHHRLFNPELGGGALLDVGVYPMAFAQMVLGNPETIQGLGQFGATGVDEQSAWVMRFPGGQLALCAAAVRTETSQRVVISGTDGEIIVHKPFWVPTRLTLNVYGREKTEIEMPLTGNGYNYQAVEVGARLRAGDLESPVMPHADTLAIAGAMDTLRGQWGLVYPQERR